jgi:hypothetical protein
MILGLWSLCFSILGFIGWFLSLCFLEMVMTLAKPLLGLTYGLFFYTWFYWLCDRDDNGSGSDRVEQLPTRQ